MELNIESFVFITFLVVLVLLLGLYGMNEDLSLLHDCNVPKYNTL
jgi:hypothetical protein